MALHIKVRRTRPRVYLSEYNLAEIRTRIETTHLEEWSQLVVWSRGMAKAPREYRLRDERLAERARRLAFMYAVRPEERLVEMGLEAASALAGQAPGPSGIEALAQLYDSFRARLEEDLARGYAEALARGSRQLYRGRVKGRPVLSPARSQAVAPLLSAGLSIYLDHPEAQGIIGEAVHASRDLVGTLQYFLEKDGGFPLGWAEGLTHLGQLPKLAMLAESGLDQKWPRDVPWLKRYAEFLEDGMQDLPGPSRPDEALGASELAAERKAGPFWPGGAETGPRRAELWRVLAMIASESGAPSALRLFGRVRLPGHQDERILYEKRPLPTLAEGPGAPAWPDRTRTRLYRRAGLAVFRDVPPDVEARGGAAHVEVVARCPGALVAGGERLLVGSFSVSCGACRGKGPLSGGRVPNGLRFARPARDERKSIGDENAGVGPPAAFPRTRHEIGQSEFHTSTIIAFEADVGAMLEGGRGLLDWLRVDLTPAHGGEAARAVRTFVMLRGLPRGPGSALVVADEVRLGGGRAPGGEPRREVASVVSFTGRPVLEGDCLTLERRGVRLRDYVLEPEAARVSLEEAGGPPGRPEGGARDDAVWRALVTLGGAPGTAARQGPRESEGGAAPDGPEGAPGTVRACQVFVVDAPGRDGPPGRDRPGGDAAESDPLCVLLPSEGALAIEAAGRALVVGGGDTSRVECVTAGPVNGVAAVGLKPSAKARLEVAGGEAVESETSAGGSVYFDARVPAGTGFVVTAEGEAE